MGQKVKTSPPLMNFRDPPSFLPEGVLYSFPGVVNHINAANMQKYDFLYKPHSKIFTFFGCNDFVWHYYPNLP